MSTLENIVRGAAVGAGTVLDPAGALINLADMHYTGAGPGDRERAIPTAWANIVQAAYPRDLPRPLIGGYIARLGGLVGGVVTTAIAGTYLVAAAPVLGYTAAVLGIYGAARGIGRYINNFIFGEKINGAREKGSFKDGARLGWHQGSYGIPWVGLIPGLRHIAALYNPMVAAHEGEAFLDGRGYESSTWRSSRLRSAAGGARRNFASIAGNVVGSIGGALASPITGIYKTVRDFFGLGGNYRQRTPATRRLIPARA